MDRHDPAKMVQPMIEGLINIGVARGIQEATRQFVKALGAEKGELDKVDTTPIEEHDFGDYRLVVLTECPFSEVKKNAGEWSEKAQKITESYNIRPASGGGAFDPICVMHRYARQELDKEGIIQLGCASPTAIIVSQRECDKIGMSKEQAEGYLEGRACLYAVPK